MYVPADLMCGAMMFVCAHAWALHGSALVLDGSVMTLEKKSRHAVLQPMAGFLRYDYRVSYVEICPCGDLPRLKRVMLWQPLLRLPCAFGDRGLRKLQERRGRLTRACRRLHRESWRRRRSGCCRHRGRRYRGVPTGWWPMS